MSILSLSLSQSVYLSVAFWLSKIRQIFIILGDIHYDQQQHLIWQWSSTYDDDDGNNKNHTNASDESRECEWNVTALNVIVRREHNRVREVKRKSCIVKKSRVSYLFGVLLLLSLSSSSSSPPLLLSFVLVLISHLFWNIFLFVCSLFIWQRASE